MLLTLLKLIMLVSYLKRNKVNPIIMFKNIACYLKET